MKSAIRLAALAAGLVSLWAPAALAGSQATILSASGFAHACPARGGSVAPLPGGALCTIGALELRCAFSSINADCRWDGRRTLLIDSLLGPLDSASIGGGGGGGGPAFGAAATGAGGGKAVAGESMATINGGGGSSAGGSHGGPSSGVAASLAAAGQSRLH